MLGSLILGEGDCSSPGELSTELELSSGAMTNRLDRLEQDGLIRRVRDPDDRRGVKIELTDAGRRAWTDSTSAQARKEALVAVGADEERAAATEPRLRRMLSSLRGERRSDARSRRRPSAAGLERRTFAHVAVARGLARAPRRSRGPSAWNASGSRPPSMQSATYSASAGPCLKP